MAIILKRALDEFEGGFLGQFVAFDYGVAKNFLIDAVRWGLLVKGERGFKRGDATLEVIGVEIHGVCSSR